MLRGLFRDRWPVEQVPLAGRQMLGGARQFVFAPESCQRLPELNLLACAIVIYLAAMLPAAPTGFWDRNPRPTSGRLRRPLARTHFPKSYPLPKRLRKKATVSDHLPKGIWGHRRTRLATSTENAIWHPIFKVLPALESILKASRTSMLCVTACQRQVDQWKLKL